VLPGLPSLTAYSELGKIKKKIGIYSQYITWTYYTEGGSLSISKSLNQERFKDF
jgi:hypothetical protein